MLCACTSAPDPAPAARPATPPRTRRFELLLSARIADPTSATYDVWLPLPPREEGQDIERLSAEVIPGEGGFDFDRDAQGNRVLHVRRKGELGRPIEVKVTLAIETTERRVARDPIRPLNDVEKKALASERTNDGVPERHVQGLALPLERAIDWAVASREDRSERFLGGIGWVIQPAASESYVVFQRGSPTGPDPRVLRDGKGCGDAETKILVRDR